MSNAHAPADILAAAKTISRFAGKNLSNHAPILVVVGERPTKDILDFQNLVLEILDIARIRNCDSDGDLLSYLKRDTHPNPVFYRDSTCVPSLRVQELLLLCSRDEKRRHFLPLLLIAISEHPSRLAALSTDALLPAFVSLIGDRIVDISSSTTHVPVWKQLRELFLGTVTRRSKVKIDPEAVALVEEALRANATISYEVVMKVATDAKKAATQRGLTAITRDVLWEVFPEHFRDAVQPPEVVMQ